MDKRGNQGAGNKLSAWEKFADEDKAIFGTVYITRKQAIDAGLASMVMIHTDTLTIEFADCVVNHSPLKKRMQSS